MEKIKPWETEPNFVENEIDGYHVIVWRNPSGCLNGYVGVTREHPLFACSYEGKRLRRISVHGGLTFSDKNNTKGFKNKYWYFGFDTSHAFDLIPLMEEMRNKYPVLQPFTLSEFSRVDTYRDFQYVSEEVNGLMMQLKKIADANPNYKYNPVREYRRLHREKVREKRMHEQYEKFLSEGKG